MPAQIDRRLSSNNDTSIYKPLANQSALNVNLTNFDAIGLVRNQSAISHFVSPNKVSLKMLNKSHSQLPGTMTAYQRSRERVHGKLCLVYKIL